MGILGRTYYFMFAKRVINLCMQNKALVVDRTKYYTLNPDTDRAVGLYKTSLL
jgi:hypothetical protein